MNRKLLLLVVFFLTASFVTAAAAASSSSSSGGGAAGSTSSSSGYSGTTSDSSSSGGDGDGPFFYGLKCSDNGQLTFKQSPPIKPVVVEKEDGTSFIVTGEWKGRSFTSEEAEINDIGTYTISDPKNGNRTVECPGLKFSCRPVKLNIQECSYNEDNKVTVEFTLMGTGTSTNDILFQFQKHNSSKLFKYQKDLMSSNELGDILLQKGENDSYSLEVTSEFPLSTVKVTYPKCVGKYYVYSKIECLERKEPQKQQGRVIKIKDSEVSLEDITGKKQNIFKKTIFFFQRFFPLN